MSEPASNERLNDPSGELSGGRRTLAISLLIGLATLPDGLVPIALKAAVVDRWGVTLADAHWFAGMALIGAVLVVPLLRPLERAYSAGRIIAGASLLNAIVLMALAAPVPWSVAMTLRCVAGGCDMVTLAVLLGLLEAGGAGRAGHRYGPATLAVLLGLAIGFALGGVLVTLLQSGIFLIGASLSLLLAVAAGCSGGLLRRESPRWQAARTSVRYWPTLVFSFSDRSLAAIVTVTATLYLVTFIGMPERMVGSVLAGVLVLMALGAWPAGVLADRYGPLPVRVASVIGYVVGFAGLGAAEWLPEWAIVASLGIMGLFGAGLAPSVYVLASRKTRGALDMGGVQAAGSAGYLVGLLSAGAILAVSTSSPGVFQGVLFGGGTVYLLLNLPAVVAMAGWRAPAAVSDT
ncbi:MAG: hypothetical protein QF733_02925 [Phycisphaerales bacterium]|nr:hypothetical protein [Phycisphaerales bacterium]